jgi:dipeptidyl aminopeptidase/acylaminoacyl peptidase
MDNSKSVPSPVPLTRMSATVNGTVNINILDGSNTISQPTWAPDSGSLLFRGRNGQANWQIFRIDMGTREVKALTPKNQDVIDYARSGGVIAYLAAPDAHPEQDWWSVGPGIPDITIGTGKAFWHLLYPNVNDDIYVLPIETEVWRVRDDVASPVIDAVTHAPLKVVTKYATETLGLSPDATHLATIAFAKPPVGEIRRADLPELDQSLQYRVIDLVHGIFELSLDAPIVSFKDGRSDRYRAAWSPSGREIALSETDVAERMMVRPSRPSKSCTVAILQVAKREVQCLIVPDEETRGFLYSLEWMPSGIQLRARYRRYGGCEYSDVAIQRNGSAWVLSNGPRFSVDPSLELTVREGLNDPPVLVAIDPASNRRRVVFDPNPQFADINLGTVIPYEWNDAHGHPVRGGLVKPPDYVSGKRYPLVLKDQGKAVDLLYSRSGKHNLRKPLEILAHQELLVDWFDFWLNGHEDPDPSKAEQYSRWRKLRDARDRSENSMTHGAAGNH